jgi:hypothetical protein
MNVLHLLHWLSVFKAVEVWRGGSGDGVRGNAELAAEVEKLNF